MTGQLFGILNVDKPAEMTSRDVVNRVQRVAKPAKAGHAGTLDPLATGVLVVCVGPATRLIPHVQERAKAYRATFLLGRRSDTDDVTGQVVEAADAPEVNRADIEELLPQFVGRIEQVPPQFSAVHVEGRRAYKLARQGKPVELQPRTVEVYRIDVVDFAHPRLVVDIECGSGTYIRSIGRDLGEQLGTGAVMSELVRTRVGPYQLAAAVPLGRLTRETVAELLLPPLTAVEHLDRYTCSAQELEHVRHGRAFQAAAAARYGEQALVAVVTPDDELVCLARVSAEKGRLAPKQVFV